jgi:hypothetical protein
MKTKMIFMNVKRSFLAALLLTGLVIGCQTSELTDEERLADQSQHIATIGSVSSTIAASPNGNCPATIFGSSSVTSKYYQYDAAGVTLGVKFRVSAVSSAVGLRFFKNPNDTSSSHIGSLWKSDGTLLKRIEFTSQTASGWQEVYFDGILLEPGINYIASYFSPLGYYVGYVGGLTNSICFPNNGSYVSDPTKDCLVYSLANDPNGINGPSSIFKYADAFPDETFQAANYYVDVIVTDATVPSIPERLSSSSSSNNPAFSKPTIGIAWSPSPDGTDAVKFNVANYLIYRDGVLLTRISGSDTQYITLNGTRYLYNDDAGLIQGQAYSYYVVAEDYCGNQSAPSTTTTARAAVNANGDVSIFGLNAKPINAVDTDTSPVQVGMKFKSSINGFITEIRFYRGKPTSSYSVHLFKSDGTLIARGFVSEGQSTTPGWQRVSLVNPATGGIFRAPIVANEVYIASYHAAEGGYASDESGLANDVTHQNLTILGGVSNGGNGVYKYGPTGSFPTDSYINTNYWVDVVFSTRSTF